MAVDIKINADTSNAITALDRLQTKLEQTQDKFEKSFGKMANAALALGAALTAASASALSYADDISDMADAHGYAIEEVLAFQKALGASGGKAENAGKAFQSLSNKVDEAASGNLKALSSFEKMGFSLADLGNKSNTYIKDQLLDNIAAIKDPMERNAKAAEFFGKSLAGTDIVKFAEQQKILREEMEKYAPAIKTGGDAFDNLAKIMGDLKLAVLDAFQPLFKFISEINIPVGVMSEGFRIAGVALAYMAGAAVIRGLMALRTALAAVAVAAAANPFVALAGGIAAVATYFALGSKSADDMAASAKDAGDATQSNTRDISGANEAIQKQRDKLAEVGKELQKNFDSALRKYDQEFKNLSLSEDQKKVSEAIAKVEEDGINAKIKLQQDFSQLSKDDQARLIDDYQKELGLIDQRTAKQKSSIASQIQGISDVIAKMKDYQTAATTQAEFSKLTSDAESKALIDSVGNINTRIDLETRLMAVQKIRSDLMSRVSGIAPGEQAGAIDAISAATNGIDLLKLSYYDLGKTIKEKLVGNLVDAQISQEGFDKLIGKQSASFNSVTQSAASYNYELKKISAESRTFSAGWNKAFNDYVDSASNAANIATSLFNKFSSGIEDYFIDSLKGVDGSWKKFLASMAEDLARSTIKQSLAKLFSLGTGGKLFGGSSGGGVGSSGKGESITNPLYVKDVTMGPGFSAPSGTLPGSNKIEEQTSLWETIKTSISDFTSGVGSFLSNMFSGLGSMISSFTSGVGGILSSIGGTLFDVIGSIGGTLFDVIGSLGSGLGDILGSIMGGGGGGGGILSTLFDIGASLFGFANGGVIPNNKPVIVGERGPELLFGAGGMGVMSNQDSFGGGSTVVTYNINAVDAMSFKALVASDPSFIYAVTQQGAKGMPTRR